MIDHLTLTVSDFARSRALYEKTLAPLGYTIKMDFGQYVGFGDERKPYLWLKPGEAQRPMHLAFVARSRALVDAFHAAALAAGAKDDGAPGVRELYHPNYYGAFVIDPDGHPIEAVCHLAPGEVAVEKSAAAKRPAKKAASKKPAKKKAASKKPTKKKARR